MVSGKIIVFVLFLLSLFAGFVTGLQLYYRMAYLWGLLLFFSWVWSRIILWGVQVRRLPRATRAQAGQVFEERFEINNPGSLPRLWLVVRDESPLPGTQGSRLFPLVEGRRGRTYLARTRLSRRGVYPLGPTILESGDPLGFSRSAGCSRRTTPCWSIRCCSKSRISRTRPGSYRAVRRCAGVRTRLHPTRPEYGITPLGIR